MVVTTRSASLHSIVPISPFSSASPPSTPRTLRSTPSTPQRNKENFLPCGTPVPKLSTKRCKAKDDLIGQGPRKTLRRTKSLGGALGRTRSMPELGAVDCGDDLAATTSSFRTVQAMLQDAHEEMLRESYGDKRARELTESPLADVSEAFIGWA